MILIFEFFSRFIPEDFHSFESLEPNKFDIISNYLVMMLKNALHFPNSGDFIVKKINTNFDKIPTLLIAQIGYFRAPSGAKVPKPCR